MNKLIKLFFGILLVVYTSLIWANPEFEEGIHYLTLTNSMPPVNAVKHKVEVIEFFSYGCPWCDKLDSYVRTWSQAQEQKIEFHRSPVIFHENWEVYSRAYFVLRALDAESKAHTALFDLIQTNSKASEQEIRNLIATKTHLPEEKLSAAFYSPVVDTEMKTARELALQYQINQVPTFVIGGRYKTDVSRVGGDYQKFFTLIDYLVQKVKINHKET